MCYSKFKNFNMVHFSLHSEGSQKHCFYLLLNRWTKSPFLYYIIGFWTMREMVYWSVWSYIIPGCVYFSCSFVIYTVEVILHQGKKILEAELMSFSRQLKMRLFCGKTPILCAVRAVLRPLNSHSVKFYLQLYCKISRYICNYDLRSVFWDCW